MTDVDLKFELAKYLTDEISISPALPEDNRRHFSKARAAYLYWNHNSLEVRDSELLEICHRIEEKFNRKQQMQYTIQLQVAIGTHHPDWVWNLLHATWQYRARAIIEVIGQPNDK